MELSKFSSLENELWGHRADVMRSQRVARLAIEAELYFNRRSYVQCAALLTKAMSLAPVGSHSLVQLVESRSAALFESEGYRSCLEDFPLCDGVLQGRPLRLDAGRSG